MEPVSTITSALKNEYTKKILFNTGIRRPSLMQRQTAHHRMPKLQANGGYLVLKKYNGPEIPKHEYEDLTYTTYISDAATTFAPITSGTGELELKGFWAYGKPDLDGVWTENAKKCPTIVQWVESLGVRFGRVQLLRMTPNTLRECRWGLHLDNNNQANDPEKNGWVVRLWLPRTTTARPTPRRSTAGSCGCGSSSPTTTPARCWSAATSSTVAPRSRSRCRSTSRRSSIQSSSGTAAITTVLARAMR